ncbi:hypothetical protein [Evansella cellulosilytica]|nr:hypothetical protein [Evansella cellulosilytica]
MTKVETINFRDFLNYDYINKIPNSASTSLMSIGLIPTGSFFNMSPVLLGAYGFILTVGFGSILVNFFNDDVQEIFETLLKVVSSIAAFGFLFWLMFSGGVI